MHARKFSLTRMQSCVLLYVAELLEPAVAVAALVRLLAGVDPDVLHELVVAGERFEALLALVRLNLVAGDHAARSDADANTDAETGQTAGDAAAGPRQCTRAQLPRVHLHRALVHEDLREELPGLVGTLYFSPRNGGWQIDPDRRRHACWSIAIGFALPKPKTTRYFAFYERRIILENLRVRNLICQ